MQNGSSLTKLSSFQKNRFIVMSCGVDRCLKLVNAIFIKKTRVLEPVKFFSRCRFLIQFF